MPTVPLSDVTCQAIEQRLAEGLTQRAIAAELGISQASVSNYKNRALAIPPAERWGLGPAKLVPPSTLELTERVVILSDVHIPFHDVNMVRSALRLIAALQPHRVVFNGDLSDFFQLSRFNQGLERLDTLQEELDDTNKFRGEVRKVVPDAVIDETDSNHGSRLRTFVQVQARALVSLRSLKPAKLNMWDEYEINPHGENGFLLRREFLVKHGSLIRTEAGASAKAELLAVGISGVSGHTHRLAPYKKAGYTRREWWEGGCLCQLAPDYFRGSTPNWENGLLVGQFSTRSENFVIEPVQRFGAGLMYGGIVY